MPAKVVPMQAMVYALLSQYFHKYRLFVIWVQSYEEM